MVKNSLSYKTKENFEFVKWESAHNSPSGKQYCQVHSWNKLMGVLGLFKGQNITSRFGLIDNGIFIVNGREWEKDSMMSSLGENSKTDMSKEITRVRQWGLKEILK